MAGLLIGAVLTARGLLASRVHADIVNDVLPIITAGMVLVLLLAVVTKEWRLIVAALLICAINAALGARRPRLHLTASAICGLLPST